MDIPVTEMGSMTVTWDFLTGDNSRTICHPMQFPNVKLPQFEKRGFYRATLEARFSAAVTDVG
jgi:hypothetical protein